MQAQPLYVAISCNFYSTTISLIFAYSGHLSGIKRKKFEMSAFENHAPGLEIVVLGKILVRSKFAVAAPIPWG